MKRKWGCLKTQFLQMFLDKKNGAEKRVFFVFCAMNIRLFQKI